MWGGSGVLSPRHIVADDTSLGAHFQGFEVSAGVIPGNDGHNTVLTERCQFDLLSSLAHIPNQT